MMNTAQKLPRTYRIVGPQRQIDERETPHPRVARGEVGERLRTWRKNRGELDALRRIFGSGKEMKGDVHNSLQHIMDAVPMGAVNPEAVPVPDPAAMSRIIKEAALFLGADAVGITHLDQRYVYSHRARACAAEGEQPGEPIHLNHKYVICLGYSGDFDRYMTSNSEISDAEYLRGDVGHTVPTFMLAAYIRELGYPARAHYHGRRELNPVPLAVNAGMGELGRHGMLIHEEFGSRLQLAAVTTDLPLAVDEPVDIGVEDVCKVCMKCAQTCPTYSIPFGDKVVINGVEKWAIDVDSCYKGKLAGRGKSGSCLICVTSCCYHKRSSWWHTLAGQVLKKLPIPLRPFYIKPLLLLDDLIWGKKPWRQMQFLGYDNTPQPVTCAIPGCLAKHKPQVQKDLHAIPKPKRAGVTAVLALLCTILLLSGWFTGAALGAAEEDRVAKLVEGAKAEGKLVVYTTQAITESALMFKKFEEKYPFIKVESYRAATVYLLNKLLGEARAKKYTPDVIEMPGFQTYILKKEGIFASYHSPETRAYQEGFKDPEGKWTAFYINPYLMGYNTKVLSRKDVPTTYEGFLHPRWKGKKIGFDTKEVEWFANMLKIMGEQKGLDFLKKLVAQQLHYKQGHTLITDLIIAGEFPVGTVYPQAVEERKKKGAKIDWVGVAPVISKFNALGLASHAPHSNAGKLYIDFCLSQEGQGVMGNLVGKLPARAEVDADILKAFKGIKLYSSDITLAENYSAYSRQFADLLR